MITTTGKTIGFIGLRILTVAAAMLLQPGCVKNIRGGYDPDIPLRFDPVIYTPTKADAPTKGLYPQDQDLSVSMWNYRVGETPSDRSDQWLRDAHVQRSSTGESVWIPIPAAMWPENTQESAVLASSPYGKAAVTDLTDGVQFLNVDIVKDQTDLLYTDLSSGLTKFAGGGIINLAFKHALTQVSFQLRSSNAMDGEFATVTSVALDDVASRGNFHSLPTPGWSFDPARTEVFFFHGEQQLEQYNTPVGESLWLLPQTLSGRVRVTLRHEQPNGGPNGTEEHEHTLVSDYVNLDLQAGRRYTLTLSCKLDTDTLKLDVIYNII